MVRVKHYTSVLLVICMSMLLGCVAKDVALNEQQKRMLRCDQYNDRDRELCLQGMHVTIEDYKDDYKNFKKSKQEEADKDKKKIDIPQTKQ